jgi:ethanolamine ammonia-lyase large subunit
MSNSTPRDDDVAHTFDQTNSMMDDPQGESDGTVEGAVEPGIANARMGVAPIDDQDDPIAETLQEGEGEVPRTAAADTPKGRIP